MNPLILSLLISFSPFDRVDTLATKGDSALVRVLSGPNHAKCDTLIIKRVAPKRVDGDKPFDEWLRRNWCDPNKWNPKK